MFAERGYDATTVRKLARDLGVSHNLLNVRFGLKANLWKAAVDWRMAEASTTVVAAFDGQGDAEPVDSLHHATRRTPNVRRPIPPWEI